MVINPYHNMQTCTTRSESKIRVKNSLFLSLLMPVVSKDEADAALASIRPEHPKANHHCYAYRINPIHPEEFFQDDGEPSGTAGAPILHKLQSAGLMDVLLVVIRYFGGIKLGTGGLIRAYGEAARSAIEEAVLVPLRRYQTVRIRYAYDLESLVQSVLHPFPVIFRERSYLEQVDLELLCPFDMADRLESQLQAIGHQLSDLQIGPDVVAPDPQQT